MDEYDFSFMKLALSEAERSEAEDTQARPSVGVVIARGDAELTRAHRGHYEPGEHAEFSALTHDLAHVDVKGATAYTTLEPCTARGHDKLPCAAWLIARGIARVVIGMLDPDPKICGKGYWLLRENGITVEFFPPELMAQAEVLNRSFIDTKLLLETPDEIPIGSDAPNLEVEEQLVANYCGNAGFEETCLVDGVIRPNVCVTTLPGDIRRSVRSHIERYGPDRLERVNRDVLLLKVKDQNGEPFVLQYHSGKARSGWNTWLFPSVQRKGTHLTKRLRNHAIRLEGFLRLPSGSTRVVYAPGLPRTVSVKTNRYASEPDLRLIPKLYIFRYCFVALTEPGGRVFEREHAVIVDRDIRRFRWMHAEALEDDQEMWRANADVTMTLHEAFGSLIASVPETLPGALLL